MAKLKGQIIGYKKEGEELTIRLEKEPKTIPIGMECTIEWEKAS
jgi:hypothetical protein